MLRRVFFAGLSTCVLGLAFGFSQTAFAQDRCKNACWIDVKTGKSVPTVPLAGVNTGMAATLNAGYAEISGDGKTAFNTRTKQNYAREANGSWIDVKTGKCVPTVPLAGVNTGMAATLDAGYAEISADGKTAFNTRTKQNYARVPCPSQAAMRTTNIRSNDAFHPFFALEAGGGWSNTNFAVAPPFGVSGSGFIGGINGGVLIDIPGTIFSAGPRIGWQGGNMSGSTANPPASPFFIYDVKTTSIFYQEALLSIPIQRELFGFEKTFLDGAGQISLKLPFVTASAGVAEVRTQVSGTSGAFQVTDSVTRTGFTGTVGVGFPISPVFLGGELDAYAQYRFIALPSATVSIPGQVQIDNRWIQGINFGLEFRY
ncbi:MAG: outer membrane beta-barrel protein [Rhizobiales bacterium]|nr:outer membrane beta-barrel protein [Hyphomicrobiales bacterium]